MRTRSLRLPDDIAETLARVAETRFGGDEMETVCAAITALAELPTLSVQVWHRLQANARRRLRQALTEPELMACMAVTRVWWVTGVDAAGIDVEIEEALENDLDDDADSNATELADALAAIPGLDGSALVAKLRDMPDLDRAVLSLTCREWWASPEPRPPLSAVLGGPLGQSQSQ